MSGEPITTIVGNLVEDPSLRFTAGGLPVANFTVASTPRKQQQGEWVDGDPLFMRCSVWREYAENVAGSLTKGQQVIVQGRLVQRSWEQDGQKRSSVELEVEEVGPCLRWGQATFTRSQQQGRQPARAATADPWAGSDAPF